MANDKSYKLAKKIYDSQICKMLEATQIFGVQLQNGEIAYCLSNLYDDERSSFEVYIGDSAFNDFRMFEFERFKESENENFIRQKSCKYLNLYFVAKEDLTDFELAEKKDFSRRNKIQFRGKNSQPRFLQCKPFFADEPISDAKDEEILQLAMEALLEVHDRFDNLPRGIDFTPQFPLRRKFPVLEPTETGFQWHMKNLPPLRHISYPAPKLSSADFNELKKLPKKLDIPAEIFVVPYILHDSDDDKFKYSTMLMLIDLQANKNINTTPSMEYFSKPEELLKNFVEILKQRVLLPKKIIVRNERSYQFFEDFCDKLEIELCEVENIEDMNLLEDTLVAHIKENFGSDGIKFFTEILGTIFNNTPENAKRKLFPKYEDFLRQMLDDDDCPIELKQKVAEIFNA